MTKIQDTSYKAQTNPKIQTSSKISNSKVRNSSQNLNLHRGYSVAWSSRLWFEICLSLVCILYLASCIVVFFLTFQNVTLVPSVRSLPESSCLSL